MKIVFIRHGKTIGNTQKRYIGITDEEILESAKEEIEKRDYPLVEKVFSSPLKRCLQTAEIIYGNYEIKENLREMDFGDFEGKNYIELSDNVDYSTWVNSNCESQIPNGENVASFKNRCVKEFLDCVKENADKTSLAFVVHGGTIMAVLSSLSLTQSNYFDWQVKNGSGYTADFINGKLENICLL